MHPYMNEEVAWQRLQDLQREFENSRLVERAAIDIVRRLAARAWSLTRRHPRVVADAVSEDRESKVA